MKILHILNSDFGVANTMGYRSYQIVKQNKNINVFCRYNGSDIKEKRINTPFPFYREYSRFTQLVLKKLGNGRIYSILRKIELISFESFFKKQIMEYDIIHFFYHSPSLINYAKQFKKKVFIEAFTHPKYIEEMHNNGLQLDTVEFDDHSVKSYLLSDIIISPSNWVTTTMLFAKIPLKKVKEVYYGVHAQELNDNFSSSNKIRIVFAGGLKRTKGILELLEAISLCDQSKVECYIFGRLFSSIKKDIDKITKNMKNIYFMGFSNNIIEEYKKSTIYVYPTYFEGSSKTVFEAMSCGLPVITTPNAGSIVRNEIDGFIVPVNNVEKTVEKINYFIYNPKEIKRMGQNAQMNSRNYTWERYSENVNKLYNEN
jgi:glycosyltransferase involved in cell wall biosynthesis